MSEEKSSLPAVFPDFCFEREVKDVGQKREKKEAAIQIAGVELSMSNTKSTMFFAIFIQDQHAGTPALR